MSAARASSSPLTRTRHPLLPPPDVAWGSPDRGAGLLAFDECRNLGYRVQVVGHKLRIVDVDPVALLQVTDELEDAGRIHDAALLERVVIGEGEAARCVAKQKVIDDERAQFLKKSFHR